MRFFCWEKAPTGEWIPCLYTDKPLAKSSNGQLPDRGPVFTVDLDDVTLDSLILAHPAPMTTNDYSIQ